MIRLIFIVILCGSMGFAWPMAVGDFGEWARTAQVIKRLSDQYKTLTDQLNTLNRQYGQLTRQTDLMSHHYGFGDYLENDTDRKARQWSPDSWEKALEESDSHTDADYESLLNHYDKIYNSSYQNDHHWMSTSEYRRFSRSKSGNRVTTASAQYVYNHIQSHLNILDSLAKRIESEKNSGMKSAMDLNSRIQVEIAYLSIESLKMQSLLNQSSTEQSSLAWKEKEKAMEFNQANLTFKKSE